MSKLSFLLLFASATFLLSKPAPAKIITLTDAPYSAAGDGVSDDRPALARAFGALTAGDTLVVPPGGYRIVLGKAALAVPDGVTVWGQSGKSRFILSTDADAREHREFLRPGGGVTLEGLVIERDQDFPAVLLPIFGDAENVTLRNCVINGNAGRFPGAYCHAIQVGVGKLKNLLLHGVEIRECTFGLFQQNAATGSVGGVTVERSLFERNTASDLEFNAPKGEMRNVVVRDCFFRNNQCKTAAAGFAVGFANVQGGRVENCVIQNYSSEALHVEDRSTDITLTGNTIVGGSLGQPNGVVLVVNGAKRITIDRNFIDARPNSNRAHLVLATAGGARFANPSDVSVTHNVLINGASTSPWYLQPGSGPAPDGNLVLPQSAQP